jgi:hypothetical protein
VSKEVEQAKAALRGRLAALEVEGKQIRGALASLEGGAEPRQRRRRRSSSSPRRTRAKKGERQAEFKATLKANPNYQLSEIARSMGIDSKRASAFAKKLVDSGEIKRVGRGRYRLA